MAWKGEELAGRPVVHAWSCQLHGRRPFGAETSDDGHRMLLVKLAEAWGKEERAGWSRMASEICWSYQFVRCLLAWWSLKYGNLDDLCMAWDAC